MNFKKLLVTASLVLAAGCASHPKPVAVTTPPPPPAVTAAPVATATPAPAAPAAPVAPAAPTDPLLMSGKGWSLKVPDASWEIATADELPADDVLALTQSEDLTARAMLLRDPVPANVDTAAFSKVVLKGVTENGGKVLKTAKATINGNQFVWADTSMAMRKTTLHVQIWALAKDGNGYALMCGSPTTNPKVPVVCKQIASTLTVE